MVRINKFGEIYIKLLYWGAAGSGKTTAVDTLYQIAKKSEEVTPTGNLTKIAMASGSTMWFDRGIFQSKRQKKVFYHVYTVAGQSKFFPLRKKIFIGTDGIVFVFDAQKYRLEENIESLRELKQISENKLIFYLPLLIMLNKMDLPNVVDKKRVNEILKDEGLLFDPGHPLHAWNPLVYESIAIYGQAQNVYQIFSELARRTSLYQVYGEGRAPDTSRPVNLNKDVPDL